MHVSAPNFDICVGLSVGIKHATERSDAQEVHASTSTSTSAQHRYHQLLETLRRRLAVADLDQRLGSSPGLIPSL